MATEDRWHDFAKEKPSEDMEGRDFIVSNGYSDTLSMWCGGYWENEPFMGNRLCDEVVRWKGYLTPEEEKANEATRKELLAEKDKEIEELKAKLEDAKATAYTESVDAGMEIRRLNHKYWSDKAEEAAKMKRLIYNGEIIYLDEYCNEKDWRIMYKVWEDEESKCRAKAEEYK